MIQIGLAGWGDHEELYANSKEKRSKLKTYSTYFPIVEVDSSFYAIQPIKNYVKWLEETPPDFGFVIKAYQGMTGHLRGHIPFVSQKEMFQQFKESIQPVIHLGKLKAVLFQYPPWFTCTRENVAILRYTKEAMEGVPVALEFRNQTWFRQDMRDKTLEFMEKEGWIHSICDEPQVGMGSVPIVLHSTNPALAIVRLHGRNTDGWNNNGENNWRDVRYLYRYNRSELLEWKNKLELLESTTQEICLIFNNNSGGDAAANAKEMMEILGIPNQSPDKSPKSGQISLFEWD